MSSSVATPPEWRLERHESTAELRLSGDWVALETGVRSPAELRRISVETGGGIVMLSQSIRRQDPE